MMKSNKLLGIAMTVLMLLTTVSTTSLYTHAQQAVAFNEKESDTLNTNVLQQTLTWQVR